MEKKIKNEYYSYLLKDNKSNDVYRVVLLCLALIVILFSVWAYSVIIKKEVSVTSPKPSTSSSTIIVQKEQIIERFKTADKVPLTHGEQINSIRFISTQNVTYTQEEKDLIVKMLGSKK